MKAKNEEGTMKQITRTEAESLFLTSKVIESCIEQDKNEMCIRLTLANRLSFMVKYNTLDHQKSYFVQQAVV